MTEHNVGTREEWLAALVELLEEEKELTRHRKPREREDEEHPDWPRLHDES
jgi:predicted dithiol-disulfide oxidoreductase (DUF899 family)